MKRIAIVQFVAVIFLLFLHVACKKQDDSNDAQPASSRSFYMAFTPFPYDISADAVHWVYDHIGSDADMICHSFDEGIPWDSALADAPFSDHIMNDWTFRKLSTTAGHKIFVQQSCLSFYRTGLALLRDSADNEALIHPWDTIRFNNPLVETAYLNYCKRIIGFFQPDYFNFSIEANMLLSMTPSDWNDYKEFHIFIYNSLKSLYPDLPILFSFQGSYLLNGELEGVDYDAQHQAVTDLLPYTDIFGISIYPYATALSTDDIPADLFDRLASYAGTKPMAVTETGYLSSTLVLTSPPVTIPSDPQKQNDYISFLLQQADAHHFLFVNNFILRDYDALWEASGAVADISALWRNTGLYDSAGVAKPALSTWLQYLARTKE